MPFGLTNAPAAFQCFMNNVFSDLLDVCVVVYLDDILIYFNNITQHWSHVKEVLKWLQKVGLYTKAEKCKFHLDSIEYLGYVLSSSGLTMSDAKVKTIQKWPEPKKVKDIQSFLGFANFYRRFIFNYSDIVILLTCWWGIKGNLISRQGWQQMEITRLRDVSQLCTKQVGTGEVFK